MEIRDAISLISRIRVKVNRRIVSEMSKHGVEGIVTSHGDIIYALFQAPRLTMAEIAGKIGKDKSTVTALVDKLIGLGYVAKERDTADTRVVYVTLSGKGNGLRTVFEKISKQVLNDFYSGISDGEQQELIRILNKIHDNL